MYPVKLHLFTLHNLCFTRLHRRPVIERTSGGSVARHTSGFRDKLLVSSSFCSSVMIQTLFLSRCKATSVSGRLWGERIKRSPFYTPTSNSERRRALNTVCLQLHHSESLSHRELTAFHTIPNQPLASRSIHRDCLVAHETLNKGHRQDISMCSVLTRQSLFNGTTLLTSLPL